MFKDYNFYYVFNESVDNNSRKYISYFMFYKIKKFIKIITMKIIILPIKKSYIWSYDIGSIILISIITF